MDDRRRELGYEHDYRLWMDYSVADVDYKSLAYHFEIRTNFILKSVVGDEMKKQLGVVSDEMLLGRENFRLYVEALHKFDASGSSEPESDLRFRLLPRLREYWMLDHEVEELVRKALDCFAVGRISGPPRRFVAPVVVEIDVRTVQRNDGEGAAAALDRAIGVESLVPLRFHDFMNVGGFCFARQSYLLRCMVRRRVEDAGEGEGIMGICAVCLREPRVGDHISVLVCKHAFHYHCVVTWLMKKDTCPLCRCDIVKNAITCCC